jgi:hypothetical protein
MPGQNSVFAVDAAIDIPDQVPQILNRRLGDVVDRVSFRSRSHPSW